MKNILYSLIAFLGILMVLPGCKKDEVLFAKPGESRSAFYQDYDAFGPKLEIGVSRALNQFEFKEGVIKMTQEMPMGDFEVLLTDLLARETTDPAKTLRDVLLSAADGVFTANELDDYMAAYPSMILGVRGPVISWALGQHIPPVVFVPSGFEESEQYIQGTRNGRPVEVSLAGQFTEAVG